MLILTRRVDESVTIGDSISVMIVSIKGNKIRIGISAPEGVKILRPELIQRTQSDEDEAS